MEALKQAVHTTPIIDHHAHNLLKASRLQSYDILSITSEAQGEALLHSTSTLAHLRAVKQLSGILHCQPNWQDVKEALKLKHQRYEAWAIECFKGIETVLVDDGLGSDPTEVHSYAWHSQLTRSNCKRILRIEKVAEDFIQHQMQQEIADDSFEQVYRSFRSTIEDAIADPEVAGFKSVICYRTGLAIKRLDPKSDFQAAKTAFSGATKATPPGVRFRLKDKDLNPYFLHLTAWLLKQNKSQKPLQFHTGLGDNDINLHLSNPAHLQPFIETFPEVNIVLLHGSYPFTTEAGYLASVYKNTYLDIGEVFPFLSQDGQERVLRQSLDLCPSEKLLWSTDGHLFPETYLLAVIQYQEALYAVLKEYVKRGALSVEQAVKIVEDLSFNTANRLYALGLDLNVNVRPLNPRKEPTRANSTRHNGTWASPTRSLSGKENGFARDHNAWASPTRYMSVRDTGVTRENAAWVSKVTKFDQFVKQTTSVKFVRLQWLDYTATLRVRILPINQALKLFKQPKFIGATKAVLGLLQNDQICNGFIPIGEYDLVPDFDGIRLSSKPHYATVQCEFREKSGEPLSICPRTALRHQVEKGLDNGVSFKVGFEIEVVFMPRSLPGDHFVYHDESITEGHCWSSASALREDRVMDLVDTIVTKLDASGIELLQFHAESAPGQFEFALGPLPPLEAVDTLIAARDIISTVTANYKEGYYHATLYPKPFKMTPGNGAHIHISMEPAHKWEHFIAGVLRNLRAMSALLYANEASYERVVDGAWAGSTWIAWGQQNRETPLRQIEGSHFEIKCTDGLANPYLVLAAFIGTGLDAVLERTPLTMDPCRDDPAALSLNRREELGISEQFPNGIVNALMAFESSIKLRSVLGDSIVQTYVTVKVAEHEMLQQMEPDRRRNWLIERY